MYDDTERLLNHCSPFSLPVGIVKDVYEHYLCDNSNITSRLFIFLIIQSLPGLVEHFSLRQLSGSEARGNKEHEHAGNHEVLEVVLDQVKALAGGDPGAVEVESVGKDQDS